MVLCLLGAEIVRGLEMPSEALGGEMQIPSFLLSSFMLSGLLPVLPVCQMSQEVWFPSEQRRNRA